MAAVGGRGEEILALLEVIDRATAALVERVGAFDAAEEYTLDGAYSTACWIRARADVSRADSLQLQRFANQLRDMPVTRQARLLAAVVSDRTRSAFAEDEGRLVDGVQAVGADSAKDALDQWRRAADIDGPDPSTPERNRASLTIEFNGRWHLDADLDLVNGALLKSTLQALQDRMHDDGRFNDLTTVTNTASRRLARSTRPPSSAAGRSATTTPCAWRSSARSR